jgi:hypothetical protein
MLLRGPVRAVARFGCSQPDLRRARSETGGSQPKAPRTGADDRRRRYVRAPRSERERGRVRRTARLWRTIPQRKRSRSLAIRRASVRTNAMSRRNLPAV